MVKFDGKTFNLFTTQTGMPINDIWNIRVTPDNKIWYFSKSRELGYIENDSIYKFTSNIENEVLSPRIIGQSNDSIFFQSGNSSYELKNNFFVKSLLNKKAKYINVENIIGDSVISYLVSDRKSDSIFFKNKFDKIVWDETFNSEIENETLVHGQLNDSLHFYLSDKGIVFFNFKSHLRKTLNYKDQLNVSSVNISRLHDVNNKIQVTGEHFVSYLSKDYNLTDIIYLPEELDTHFSFIDKSGNLWSASFSKGVFFHPIEKLNSNTYFLNNKVQNIELIDGQIYTSVYKKGLFKYNPEKERFDSKLKNLHFNYQINKIDSIDIKIFSTEIEVYTFNDDKFTLKKNHYKYRNSNVLGRKFVYFNGFIYSNNHEGINKLDSKTFKYIENYKGLAINNIIPFNEELILGSSSGLKKLTDKVIVNIGEDELFKLPVLVVEKLNNSTLLIGTDGSGVYTYDGYKANLLKETDNLSVEDIFVENENEFWIATQKGVYKLIETDTTYSIGASYFKSDGLLTNKVNSIVVKDSMLYAGTDIGVSSFNYNKLYKNDLNSIYIKNILIGNKKFKSDDISVKFKRDNNVQINFGLINFQNQDNITTSYRLFPLQKKWTIINSNQINLNNLSPDDYILEIKVLNHENIEMVKQIPIEITPVFWQKLWFQILAILLGVFLFGYSIYYFIKKVQQKKHQKLLLDKELSEIQLKALRAQMNPHFVFNSLAAIQYYINNNDFEASENYLVKFSKLIRKFFEITKENEILISDEIKLLNGYLEIEKLRFKNKLNFNIIVDKKLNLKTTKIPTMILQPIVENAVNHGIFNKLENGHVEIRFAYIDDDNFIVEIKDDGVGMINTKKHRKNKIISSTVLKDRLYYLNKSGEWEIGYSNKEVFPDLKEKGNISIFTIRKLVK